jgi:hypothetical protein
LAASELPIRRQSGARSDERIGANFLTIARCERLSLQHNNELRRWIRWNQLTIWTTMRFTGARKLRPFIYVHMFITVESIKAPL